PESFHVSPRSRGGAPAHGRDRGTGAGTDARGVGQREPHATVALQMGYDHRTVSARYCLSLRGAEDAARRDPINPPVFRAADLENLAGRRGPANGRATLGTLGALEALTNPVSRSIFAGRPCRATPPSVVIIKRQPGSR